MSVNAMEEITRAICHLKKVLDAYSDDGDWYGCVRHAQAYLNEATVSSPPGAGRPLNTDKDIKMDKCKRCGKEKEGLPSEIFDEEDSFDEVEEDED